MKDDVDHLPECTIAEIALDFPHAIKVLNRYDLDYCCHGSISFADACHQNHLNPRKVWSEILNELPIPSGIQGQHFNTWDIPLIIDFIIQNHHEYIRISVPQMQELINKITSNHSVQYPELVEIRNYFNILAEELLDHLPKEEEILFPAIRRLATSRFVAENSPLLANIQGPVTVMESEHSHAGEILKMLRSLTNHYHAPAGTCPTFQSVFRLLEEFDDDLVQHIHLENNILFPKVKV
jgi:regulator of cell morphogenesis and NO signaling